MARPTNTRKKRVDALYRQFELNRERLAYYRDPWRGGLNREHARAMCALLRQREIMIQRKLARAIAGPARAPFSCSHPELNPATGSNHL